MQISRVTRVSNPRRRTTAKRRRSNPKRLSLKQKLHFGTARQRAAAKASLRNSRKRKSSANPKRRRATTTTHRRKAAHRRRSNPSFMITLPGAINPAPRRGKSKRRTKKSMATKTRRRRASANPRRRRRNSVKVVVRRRNRRRTTAVSNPRRRRRATARRANPVRRRRVSHRRHHSRGRSRNPVIFGKSMGVLEAGKIVAAGLGGVWATQFVVNMLPANMLPSTPVTGALVSAGVAFGLGAIATMIFKSDPMIGYAIGFGGLMQAGGVLAKSVGLAQFGLRGLGDIVPGRFPVPQNPIMAGNQPMMLPAASPVAQGAGVNGLAAIYNPFGRAM